MPHNGVVRHTCPARVRHKVLAEALGPLKQYGVGYVSSRTAGEQRTGSPGASPGSTFRLPPPDARRRNIPQSGVHHLSQNGFSLSLSLSFFRQGYGQGTLSLSLSLLFFLQAQGACEAPRPIVRGFRGDAATRTTTRTESLQLYLSLSRDRRRKRQPTSPRARTRTRESPLLQHSQREGGHPSRACTRPGLHCLGMTTLKDKARCIESSLSLCLSLSQGERLSLALSLSLSLYQV